MLCSLISIVRELALCNSSLALWCSVWSIRKTVPYGFEKNVYSAVDGQNSLYMFIKFVNFTVQTCILTNY